MMDAGGSGAAMEYMRRLFQSGAVVGLTDGELLERFVRRDEASAEAAFTALVERHGPMVLRVCRALLRDVHEAEDAFQATFLVLARRAGSIRAPGLLANWLYGVAHRTARKARARSLGRRSREVGEDAMRVDEVVDRADEHEHLAHREHARIVHEELQRLPETQRAVVVLCCLEGINIEETARRLRCTPGAVRGRLAQARSRLRDRLVRRGVAVPSAILAAALSEQPASAALPPGLRDATIQAAMGLAGKAAVGAVASATAVATARRVSRLMVLSELTLPVAALAAVVAVLATLGAWLHEPRKLGGPNPHPLAAEARNRQDDPRPFVEAIDWVVSAVDPDGRTIAVQAGRGQASRGTVSLVSFRGLMVPSGLGLAGMPVAAEARITLDGRPAELTQVREGMQASLELTPDRLAVSGLRARSQSSPSVFVATVDAVDVAGRTILISVPGRPERLSGVRLADGVQIRRSHAPANAGVRVMALGLGDLRPGMPASINLNIGEDGRLLVSSLDCAVSDDGKERSR